MALEFQILRKKQLKFQIGKGKELVILIKFPESLGDYKIHNYFVLMIKFVSMYPEDTED